MRLLLIVALLGLPLDAQPPSPQPCDQDVDKLISVNGLQQKDLKYPVSSLTIPTLGYATTDMASFIDPLVGKYMNKTGSAGGTVALTYNNQLVFAKSYGYADVDNGLVTQPDSILRIASISKALTAMGVLKLVHDSFGLEVGGAGWQLNYQPFVPPGFGTPIGGTRQTWIQPATVNDLLYHEGGWAEDYENYNTLMAVETLLGTAGPPDCQTLLQYVESRPMMAGTAGMPGDFAPGTGQIYSNVGFCALGQTIRRLSGAASYIDYMQANVLNPLGMLDTQLGSSKQSEQLDREVVYYPCGYVADRVPPVTPIPCGYETPPVQGKSLFPPHKTVSAAYGGGVNSFSLQASEGAGGFVSTSIDLARFSGAIASGQLPDFQNVPLFPGWPQLYYGYSTTETPYEISQGFTIWNGMGWDFVVPNPVAMPFLSYDNFNLQKNGGYPGTVSAVATTADGYSFAAIFNGDSGNSTPSPADQLFWPSPAGVLQAAYAHAALQPWNVDFFHEYSQPYTGWMKASDFATYLAAQESSGFYPSRLEGRTVPGHTPEALELAEYRARFDSQKLVAGSPPPQVMYGQSCSAIMSAIKTAPASTPLVSLQRFLDPYTYTYAYQAVWSAPIPQLPGN